MQFSPKDKNDFTEEDGSRVDHTSAEEALTKTLPSLAAAAAIPLSVYNWPWSLTQISCRIESTKMSYAELHFKFFMDEENLLTLSPPENLNDALQQWIAAVASISYTRSFINVKGLDKKMYSMKLFV